MSDSDLLSFDEIFASFLSDRSGLPDRRKGEFKEICASLITAMQDGHSCIELSEPQVECVVGSHLVSTIADSPLVLSNNKLYLARHFNYEKRLAVKLSRLAAVSYQIEDVDQLLSSIFSGEPDQSDQQLLAARVALTRGLCIIAGGPGTGKTTTVVKIVTLLMNCYGNELRVALAAPTGKAAMRLQESVKQQLTCQPMDETIKHLMALEPYTLHRLLGVRKHAAVFRHNEKKPLPWDVIIVDEASMVDLALMTKLVDALAEGSRLVLLGDKDQLASVESGAVFSDCLQVLSDNVVELRTAYRFNEEISAFAAHINKGEGAAAAALINDPAVISVNRAGSDWLEYAVEQYGAFLRQVASLSNSGDLSTLFYSFNRFRILCALKNGRFGVSGVNESVEWRLAAQGFDCKKQEWYQGRPVLITRNDYNLGLYNGDIGICLSGLDGEKNPVVWFEKEPGRFCRYLPARLPALETAWALTIHKSQGSEFYEVMIVLPDTDNRILSRELLYTGITRARKRVLIHDEGSLCQQAANRRISRQSGLAEQLMSVGNNYQESK